MAKYDIISTECEDLSSEEIIEKYELTHNEVEIMRYLYQKQYQKHEIIEYIYDITELYKADATKLVGALKKKGLIYSVIDLRGFLGTEIKV